MVRRAARLGADGRVVIPRNVREAAHLHAGEAVAFEVTDRGMPLRPIDPDQAWFWTPEWQESEHEAEAEIASGDLRFESDEEFLALLDRSFRGS